MDVDAVPMPNLDTRMPVALRTPAENTTLMPALVDVKMICEPTSSVRPVSETVVTAVAADVL